MKQIFLILIFVLLASSAKAESIKVYTFDWEPYINLDGLPKGEAAKVLEVTGKFSSLTFDWDYIPYSDAQALLKLGADALSYPYFYSEVRAQSFIYSKPLYFASVSVFYNRRNTSSEDVLSMFAMLKKGVVSGNSYGESLDEKFNDSDVFQSELEAINALLSGEIEALPMADGVMETMLKKYFNSQKALIQPILNKSYRSQLGMHVIAPKNGAGKKLIEEIDKAILIRSKVKSEFKDTSRNTILPVDTAQLKPSEGYPAILGRLAKSQNRDCLTKSPGDLYYTMPINTKVLVLEWSEHVRAPSATDRIYGNMMEESFILVLNGPHVGKELCVKNMHVELL